MSKQTGALHLMNAFSVHVNNGMVLGYCFQDGHGVLECGLIVLLIGAFASQGKLCSAGSAKDVQSMEDQMLDIVMMRLRTADGLDLAEFAARYGSAASKKLLQALELHEKAGLVTRTL